MHLDEDHVHVSVYVLIVVYNNNINKHLIRGILTRAICKISRIGLREVCDNDSSELGISA